MPHPVHACSFMGRPTKLRATSSFHILPTPNSKHISYHKHQAAGSERLPGKHSYWIVTACDYPSVLTLIPLTWRTWWAPNKASRWQIGFKSPLNLLAPELLFLILAHSVHKMWIIQELNTLELWNKLHSEEENNVEYIPCLKYSVTIFVEYIKCNV
jgi:hypothetical protein